MKHLLRPFLVAACFLLAVIVTLEPVWAQGPPPSVWATFKAPNPFPPNTRIHIVKFNALGSKGATGDPLVGCIGLDSEIWYTTNGGGAVGNWQLAKIHDIANHPTPFSSGWVNDIAWASPSDGFAIIDSNSNPADHGVLITTDGGASWTFDDAPGTPDSGCGIYYNTSNNLLFVASLDKGLVVSSDNGQTWSTINPAKYFTGFAFTDPLHGVVATQGSFPGYGSPTNYWLYTTDGGKTWQQSRMFFESWQPIGIPTTKRFFAATLHYQNNIAAILQSDNGGYAFAPIPGFNNGGDRLTQAMQGDGCSLFASSTTSQTAMWFSVNDGAAWQTMPATAPTPPTDTRFYVSPDTVWSFQGNILTWAPRTVIQTAAIHIWPNTVNFTGAACDTALDTIIHIFGCNCNNNDTLTAVTVTQSGGNITTVPGSLPRPLCTGTAVESAPDSIHLLYEPTNIAGDTGVVDVRFSQNGVRIDTFVAVHGNGVSPKIHPDIPSQIVLSAPACGSLDTCFEIINTSCSCVQILNCVYPDVIDPCTAQEIQVDGPQGCGQFPQTLEPGQRISFCVHFQAGLRKSSNPLPEMSIAFHWKACYPDTEEGQTDFVNIYGITTSTALPSFRGFDINVASCCDLPQDGDTTIYFSNTTCDTLIMGAPNFYGASDRTRFTLDSNVKPPLHFPDTLPPGRFIPLKIHINCKAGVDSTHISFPYQIGTSGLPCADLIDADTVTLKIRSGANLTSDTVGAPIKFYVNCCDTTQIKTTTLITRCLIPDTLVKITFNSSGGAFDTLPFPLPLPATLSPDQQVPIQIRYRAPVAGTTSNGTETFIFKSGATVTLYITGNCTPQAAAPLSSDNINFGTLACGQGACDTLWIKNSPCNAVQIGFINPPGAPFTLESPASNTPLGAGDSTQVILCVNPMDTGEVSGSLIIPINNQSGTVGIPDTLTYSAYLTPPSPAFIVSQLATATICSSDTLDESFTFTNTGTCYTYVIQSANSHSNEVTVTPQTARVPVGITDTFHVHFDPAGVAGEVKDSITLTDSAGNTIEIPYDFIDTACNVQNNLVFNLTDSIIATPNCTPGSVTFTASASNGGGTITSISLTNSPRFTLTNTSTTTLPDNGTITFDPNQPGGDTATLTLTVDIGGKPTTRTVLITGVTVGAKDSARIGVVSPSNACLQANDTDLKEFDVVVHDSISNTLGMAQLHFLIRYNGDLLWNPKFTLAPGFTIANEYEDAMGLHITLNYNPPSGTTSVPMNDTIVKLTQLAALSPSLTSVARIDSAHFNDSTFEACTLRAIDYAGDSASICIDTTFCQTNLIERKLAGTLAPMKNIIVAPNPAHKDGSAATLHFTTLVSAPVTADVLNELGTPVSELIDGQLEKGDHSVPIPTNQMASGAYFVRISMNGYTVVRKFVLEKE